MYSGAADPPASTGKATVGPASNEFKAEARLVAVLLWSPPVPIDVGAADLNYNTHEDSDTQYTVYCVRLPMRTIVL